MLGAERGNVWCVNDIPKSPEVRLPQPYTKQQGRLRNDFITLSSSLRRVILARGGIAGIRP
jgi:hypothetical protein